MLIFPSPHARTACRSEQALRLTLLNLLPYVRIQRLIHVDYQRSDHDLNPWPGLVAADYPGSVPACDDPVVRQDPRADHHPLVFDGLVLVADDVGRGLHESDQVGPVCPILRQYWQVSFTGIV